MNLASSFLRLPFTIVCATSCLAAALADSQSPFSRSATDFVRDEIHIGVNIGNTLDVPSGNETDWGNVPITRELVHAYRAKGFDTIRIPISWRKQFDRDDPAHTIRPEFLARVKEVAGWCLDEGFVTIVNIHHDGGDDGWPGAWLTIDGQHEPQAERILADLWTQIATAFRDAGERLVFESFNEVRKAKRYAGTNGKQAGQEDWNGSPAYCDQVNRYAKVFYDAVRATGGSNARRYLMVPTYGAAFSENSCSLWRSPDPADNHIIADIHCYEPGDFCLWGNRKKYDKTHVQRRLDEFFPRFRRCFTEKGIPLVLGEINADLRFYDDERREPNDDARIRWAAHYVREARRYGFPCIVWETGGVGGMGIIDRRTLEWTHGRLADTFVAAGRGTLTDEQVEAWAKEVFVPHVEPVYTESDTLLRWQIGGTSGDYASCWGQTMGYGNLNGNGAVLRYFSATPEGALLVDTKGAGGNMVHQQFWADQSPASRKAWTAYVKTHSDFSAKGRMLRFTLKARNGTSALLSGFFTIPGIKGKIEFGADPGKPGCVLATPEKPVVTVELPLPEGTLDAKGKGIGAELKFIPGAWGQNRPLDAELSPIEIH